MDRIEISYISEVAFGGNGMECMRFLKERSKINYLFMLLEVIHGLDHVMIKANL